MTSTSKEGRFFTRGTRTSGAAKVAVLGNDTRDTLFAARHAARQGGRRSTGMLFTVVGVLESRGRPVRRREEPRTTGLSFR